MEEKNVVTGMYEGKGGKTRTIAEVINGLNELDTGETDSCVTVNKAPHGWRSKMIVDGLVDKGIDPNKVLSDDDIEYIDAIRIGNNGGMIGIVENGRFKWVQKSGFVVGLDMDYIERRFGTMDEIKAIEALEKIRARVIRATELIIK